MLNKLRGICITLLSLVFALPLFGCDGSGAWNPWRGRSQDIMPHLLDEALKESAPERPVDGFEAAELSAYTLPLSEADYRARVDELYELVVAERKKPVLADDDPVKPVYDAAIDILNRYVLNSWHSSADGAARIVHTVHDYLVFYIDYDFELYERYRKGESVDNDPAFGIDGVLLNRRAVCNGLSSAFNFLCAIENIESITETGTLNTVPHAWNKVRLGGQWYNVDATSDSANYVVNSGEYEKQLSHGYFLVGDATLRTFRPRTHVFTPTVRAESDYDYFSGKSVTIHGEVFELVVKNAAMLNRIFDAVAAENGAVGKLELKLDFPDKVNVNDGDMYVDEIKAAYERIKNPDFSVGDQRPYFQAPNGVYLFLIYR